MREILDGGWFIDIIRHYNIFGKIKRLFQRLFRGWDDSETWSLEDSFYNWLLPRLKRFQELNCCYPVNEEYDSFESWNNVLKEKIIELEYIIDYSYREWDFSERKYLDDEYLKSFEKWESFEDKELNCLAYQSLKKNFNKWFSENIYDLWW